MRRCVKRRCATSRRPAGWWRKTRTRAAPGACGPGSGRCARTRGRRRQAPSEAICRRSQARACAHCARTQRSLIPSSAAISSSVRPAKKRISTIAAARSSSTARRWSAASSVSRCSLPSDASEIASATVMRCQPPPRFRALRGPRVVHEDLPHRAGGDRQEVPAVVGRQLRLARELEVGLVHQRRGLERVVGPLPAQVALGDLAQVLVHLRHVLGGDATWNWRVGRCHPVPARSSRRPALETKVGTGGPGECRRVLAGGCRNTNAKYV